MSANRQRLASAIRSIALTPDERRALLGESSNKGGKAISAGVGKSEAEESRLCCDGSTGPANGGTSERDPDSGGQDASGGLDPNDPAKLTMGEGSLTGLTDCATDEPICFDGSDWAPPDGWDDPQEPPADPTWEEGTFWVVQHKNDIVAVGPTKGSVCGVAEDLIAPCLEGGFCGDGGFSSFLCNGDRTELFRANCPSTTDPSVCDYDQDNPPRATEWPSDGCTNLIIRDGKIVGSKYDPENDGSYSAPRDSIDLCDSEGNQISLAPSANGGWKTINSTTNNGYLYDSSGRQIAHIDGNEYSDPNV